MSEELTCEYLLERYANYCGLLFAVQGMLPVCELLVNNPHLPDYFVLNQ